MACHYYLTIRNMRTRHLWAFNGNDLSKWKRAWMCVCALRTLRMCDLTMARAFFLRFIRSWEAPFEVLSQNHVSTKESAYQRRCSSVCLSSIRQWGSWRVFVCVLCRNKTKSFLTIVSKNIKYRNEKYTKLKKYQQKQKSILKSGI